MKFINVIIGRRETKQIIIVAHDVSQISIILEGARTSNYNGHHIGRNTRFIEAIFRGSRD